MTDRFFIYLVVSKLTAQERAKGEYGNMTRMLKQSVIITTVLGVMLTAVLYFGAELLAEYFFNDVRVVMPLQILSFAFPFMAAGTSIRGYFIGLQETKIPAANQVLEQIVRMVVIYILAARFVPRGLEYAAAVALIAVVVEEIFSFLFVFVAYKRHRKKMRPLINMLPKLSPAQSLTLIMGMALPLTGNRVAGSLLAAWENVLIPQRLQLFGMSATDAMSEFGRITGMAVPLIFFPTAVLTALSVTIVPAVAEAAAEKNLRGIAPVASKTLLFAAITGMGAAALFMFFSNELGMAIYNQPIGTMLMLLGVMCPFIYMQIILSGVLNGLGCQMFIFRNSLLSSAICIAFIYVLVPRLGLVAYIFGWLTSLVVVIAMGLAKIRQYMPLEMEFSRWFLRPLLAAALAGLAARYLADAWLFGLAGLRVGLVVAIGVLGGIYFLGVIVMRCISVSEMRRLF